MNETEKKYHLKSYASPNVLNNFFLGWGGEGDFEVIRVIPNSTRRNILCRRKEKEKKIICLPYTRCTSSKINYLMNDNAKICRLTTKIVCKKKKKVKKLWVLILIFNVDPESLPPPQKKRTSKNVKYSKKFRLNYVIKCFRFRV